MPGQPPRRQQSTDGGPARSTYTVVRSDSDPRLQQWQPHAQEQPQQHHQQYRQDEQEQQYHHHRQDPASYSQSQSQSLPNGYGQAHRQDGGWTPGSYDERRHETPTAQTPRTARPGQQQQQHYRTPSEHQHPPAMQPGALARGAQVPFQGTIQAQGQISASRPAHSRSKSQATTATARSRANSTTSGYASAATSQAPSRSQSAAPSRSQSAAPSRAQSQAPSREPSQHASRAQSRGPSRAPSQGPASQQQQQQGRSRCHTAASSSDGSATSESEFIHYRDGEAAPLITGLQYGPYSYLNYPQNMAAERTFYISQDSLKYGPSGGGGDLDDGSSNGHSSSYPGNALPYAYRGQPMLPNASTSSLGSYASSSNNGNAHIAVGANGFPRPPTRQWSSKAPSSADHDHHPGSVEVLSQGTHHHHPAAQAYAANHANETHFLYDSKAPPEADDYMHNPNQHDAIMERRTCSVVSIRGFLNVITLILIVIALVGLFGAYPIMQEFVFNRHMGKLGGFNLGGINGTGQVPNIPNLPTLIDAQTPKSALTRTGFDGHKYELVFSDEFETPGRSFWPGDDPFWEAVDLHYWGTGDYEWYDPDAITTEDGNLVIEITKQPLNDLDYRSGMLQSWNKLCFTGGYIEVSVQLPGQPDITGFWPGVWTLGNLARAGHGATTEGVWPFSYDSCDVGTLKNQTDANGLPEAAQGLSYQPGQKLSACTCKGEDHPGPNNRVGRGAPEIDIIEAQSAVAGGAAGGRLQGEVSQSAQVAPYDYKYGWIQTEPATTIFDSSITKFNTYIGGNLQEAVSGLTMLHDDGYEANGGFRKYGFEYEPGGDENAYITWMYDDKPTWRATSATFPADAQTKVSQRLVSQEPMSIVLNLAMSSSFQNVELDRLAFPSKMKIDYVRIYQREGQINLSCDPDDYPTARYIEKHLNAYSNFNLTTWELAGYDFPKNSLVDDC